MLPIKTILHPTDFSESSRAAHRLACSLARDYGARLVVLHVYPPPLTYGELLARQPPDGYEQQLWDELHGLHFPDPGVEAEFWLEEGDPGPMIANVAADRHCDLIVMGTHGRTGVTRLLMGSVAEQVLRGAPCPVLTVKNSAPVAEVAEAAGRPLAVAGKK